MKDFSRYEGKKKEKGNPESDVFGRFASFAARYEGKSGDELVRAIVKEAEEGRKRGTLTDEKIDEFCRTIEPFLNVNQKKILGSVVKKIKSGE